MTNEVLEQAGARLRVRPPRPRRSGKVRHFGDLRFGDAMHAMLMNENP